MFPDNSNSVYAFKPFTATDILANLAENKLRFSMYPNLLYGIKYPPDKSSTTVSPISAGSIVYYDAYTNKLIPYDNYFPLGYKPNFITINPSIQTKMLTDMDKLVIDSMIQNDETIETMILILYMGMYGGGSSAEKYLKYKTLRSEIEKYVNGED